MYQKKDIYPENKGMDKKRTKKLKKAHPPESPLNGGMNSTIPLLGGVPLIRHPEPSLF
jgi:hypothetical protein